MMIGRRGRRVVVMTGVRRDRGGVKRAAESPGASEHRERQERKIEGGLARGGGMQVAMGVGKEVVKVDVAGSGEAGVPGIVRKEGQRRPL